jgi:hypothetical protein
MPALDPRWLNVVACDEQVATSEATPAHLCEATRAGCNTIT